MLESASYAKRWQQKRIVSSGINQNQLVLENPGIRIDQKPSWYKYQLGRFHGIIRTYAYIGYHHSSGLKPHYVSNPASQPFTKLYKIHRHYSGLRNSQLHQGQLYFICALSNKKKVHFILPCCISQGYLSIHLFIHLFLGFG